MNTININKDPAYCFAALKLIEQLYRDGKIPGFMFRNILSDYADIVDESLFIKGNHNHKEKIA
ncbi:MAG TPA: hypothetical protein DEB10_03895 [Ruminococcaceae bacterium]|mgnify:FL=1|nr:hypothetical protein [Clostridiales bacterium]HBT63791.1 hypothetical protein [Oscillospiraceae bacterium]